jgi:hypothetical protein
MRAGAPTRRRCPSVAAVTLGSPEGDGGALVAAILSAYDKPRLSSLLRFKGGLILENEVDTAAGFRQVVESLVVLLDQQGDTDRFLALAFADRGGNPKIRALAEARGLAAAPAPAALPAPATAADLIAAARVARPDDAALASLAARADVPEAAPAGLEALVATRSRLIDFGRFRDGLDLVMSRVCRLVAPGTAGTGFLVGPDLVLTNFHVVRGLMKDAYAVDQIVCEFDYNSDVRSPTRVGVIAKPTAFAPYGESDLSGAGEPQAGELDYALLRIAQPLGAGERGFYPLDPAPRLLAVGDFVVVTQHANAQLLALALGTVTDFPGKALRLRYDVTTEPGSSGSPCLSAELDPIGLHHAAEPGARPTYNQAVPIWLIARHAHGAGR